MEPIGRVAPRASTLSTAAGTVSCVREETHRISERQRGHDDEFAWTYCRTDHPAKDAGKSHPTQTLWLTTCCLDQCITATVNRRII
jgi:hypothetical protein